MKKSDKAQGERFVEYMQALKDTNAMENPEALAILACTLLVTSSDITPETVKEMVEEVKASQREGATDPTAPVLAYRRVQDGSKLSIKCLVDGVETRRDIETTPSEMQRWLRGGDIEECIPNATEEDRAWLTSLRAQKSVAH